MSAIFGLAGLTASDYTYVRNADQRAVFEATVAYTQARLADLQAASRVFVAETVEVARERYYLPGTGVMARRADGGRGPAVRPIGSWDVGYTLEDFAERVAGTDVDFAYMTPDMYQRAVDTVLNHHVGRYRQLMLYYLLNNAAKTWQDKLVGAITVQPLANNDAVLYPPVLGSETSAAHNHYLVSGYAASAVSNTNNPFPVLRDHLEEHFTTVTGGSGVVCFIHNDERPEVEALTAFTPVEDRFVRSGANADVPYNLPSVPGVVLGRINGVWVAEWRYVPSGYLLALHLEAPGPLKERVDPAGTGLPRGLTPVFEDPNYPVQGLEFRARYGMGVGNRLNGVVMQLTTNTSYAVPSAYANLP